VGIVPDCQVPVGERGRILGDRGSNVRKIVEVMRAALGHEELEHGRPPFVQFNQKGGRIEFEIELYPPFNDEESFELVVPAFKEMLQQIRDAPFEPESRHCMRPKRIQPDDWECPDPRCGNLCFARRRCCPLCGTERPAEPQGQAPPTSSDVPDIDADPRISRPPKHGMALISTAERLGRPSPGDCQVVWLVPLERRGYAIGRGGCTVRRIKDESGADMVLTREPELRTIGGETFCMAFLRGPPECTRKAVGILISHAGGRLGRDGLEALLDAAATALRQSRHWRLPLCALASDKAVTAAMAAAWPVMRGAGRPSLKQVLEQWPEHFAVQPAAGPHGTMAELLDDAIFPEPWSAPSSGCQESAAYDDRPWLDPDI